MHGRCADELTGRSVRRGRGVRAAFAAIAIAAMLVPWSLAAASTGAPARASAAAVPAPAASGQAVSTEIVGFLLQGKRPIHKIDIEALDVVLTPAGDRLIPLRVVLEVLQIPYAETSATLIIRPEGLPEVVVDPERGELQSGDVRKPAEIVVRDSEFSGRREFYLPPWAVSQILNMDIQWVEARYAFEGNTNREWPVWKGGTPLALLRGNLTKQEELLPEFLPPATPRRTSFDFLEFQSAFAMERLVESAQASSGLQFARSSLWGSLFDGRYALRLNHLRNERSSNTPSLTVDSATWTQSIGRGELGVGDSNLGFSDFNFPSMRLFGVRFNGVYGSGAEGTNAASRGLRSTFARPRVFEGVAPLGAKAQLFIDGSLIDTQVVLPDVSSPAGEGRFRFENVTLRPGRLSDIRIVVTESDGTVRETKRLTVETPSMAPRGTLAVTSGLGTHRDPLTNELNGVVGGVRTLYGLTDSLTIGAGVGLQGGFYDSFAGRTFSNRGRSYPGSSANVSTQVLWRPFDSVILTGDVAASRGKSAGSAATDEGYDGFATRVMADYYPSRRVKLRSQWFRLSPNFFNGQNLDAADRTGFVVDGSANASAKNRIEWAAGQVRGNGVDSATDAASAGFARAGVSSRLIPRSRVTLEASRITPSWADAKTHFNLNFESNPMPNLDIYGALGFGDSFSDGTTVNLFSGLNVPGVYAFEDASRYVRLRGGISDTSEIGAAYLATGSRTRFAALGSASLFAGKHRVTIRGEAGYDRYDDALFTEDEQKLYPYFQNTSEIYFDALGRSRLGLHSTLERGGWRVNFLFSFLSSFDERLRARLVRGRVSPEVGGVQGRVFLDIDADGLRSPGEPGLENIVVRAPDNSGLTTDRSGYFVFPASGSANLATVSLDLASVPAIYTPTSAQQKAHVVPGKMTTVNLGLTPLITVSGYLVAEDYSGEFIPVAGVPVELATESRRDRVAYSITAKDGTYYLSGLRPDRYVLRVDTNLMPLRFSLQDNERKLVIEPSPEPQDIKVLPFVATVKHAENIARGRGRAEIPAEVVNAIRGGDARTAPQPEPPAVVETARVEPVPVEAAVVEAASVEPAVVEPVAIEEVVEVAAVETTPQPEPELPAAVETAIAEPAPVEAAVIEAAIAEPVAIEEVVEIAAVEPTPQPEPEPQAVVEAAIVEPVPVEAAVIEAAVAPTPQPEPEPPAVVEAAIVEPAPVEAAVLEAAIAEPVAIEEVVEIAVVEPAPQPEPELPAVVEPAVVPPATPIEVAAAPAAPSGPSSISVNWLPWARVEIEGMPAQSTPCRFENVRPGDYVIRLAHPEFGEMARVVTVEPGQPARLSGAFESTGMLNVNAVPWAEVLINGETKGTTPLQLKLAAGTYDVRLRRPSLAGDDAAYTIDVMQGEAKNVSHRF